MDDFLRKPVTQEQLEKTMKKWLAASSTQQGSLNA